MSRVCVAHDVRLLHSPSPSGQTPHPQPPRKKAGAASARAPWLFPDEGVVVPPDIKCVVHKGGGVWKRLVLRSS